MPGCYTRPPTFPSDPVCTFPVTLSGSRTPETLHSRVDGLNKANPSMPTRKTIDRSRSTSPSGKASASSGRPPAPRGLCCCSAGARSKPRRLAMSVTMCSKVQRAPRHWRSAPVLSMAEGQGGPRGERRRLERDETRCPRERFDPVAHRWLKGQHL